MVAESAASEMSMADRMTVLGQLSNTGGADKLFMMIVFGLFYMNRSLKWSKDDNWYEMQLLVARFLFGGFEALHSYRYLDSQHFHQYRLQNADFVV